MENLPDQQQCHAISDDADQTEDGDEVPGVIAKVQEQWLVIVLLEVVEQTLDRLIDEGRGKKLDGGGRSRKRGGSGRKKGSSRRRRR